MSWVSVRSGDAWSRLQLGLGFGAKGDLTLQPSEKLYDLVLEQVVGEAGWKSGRIYSFPEKAQRIAYPCRMWDCVYWHGLSLIAREKTLFPC